MDHSSNQQQLLLFSTFSETLSVLRKNAAVSASAKEEKKKKKQTNKCIKHHLIFKFSSTLTISDAETKILKFSGLDFNSEYKLKAAVILTADLSVNPYGPWGNYKFKMRK